MRRGRSCGHHAIHSHSPHSDPANRNGSRGTGQEMSRSQTAAQPDASHPAAASSPSRLPSSCFCSSRAAPYINVSRLQRRVARNIVPHSAARVHSRNITPTASDPRFHAAKLCCRRRAWLSGPSRSCVPARYAPTSASAHSGASASSSPASPSPTPASTSSAPATARTCEELLLQASRNQAAPTAQKYAGAAPRFPTSRPARAPEPQTRPREDPLLADRGPTSPSGRPSRTNGASAWKLIPYGPTPAPPTPAPCASKPLSAHRTQAQHLRRLAGKPPHHLHGSWQDVELGGLSGLLRRARHRSARRALPHLQPPRNPRPEHRRNRHPTQQRPSRRLVSPRLLSIEAGCHATALNFFHTSPISECHWPPSTSSTPALSSSPPTSPTSSSPAPPPPRSHSRPFPPKPPRLAQHSHPPSAHRIHRPRNPRRKPGLEPAEPTPARRKESWCPSIPRS